jgi:hypothetical protein
MAPFKSDVASREISGNGKITSFWQFEADVTAASPGCGRSMRSSTKAKTAATQAMANAKCTKSSLQRGR